MRMLKWEKLPAAQRPRAGHTATIVGSKIFVFGGRYGEQFFNDLWAFDTESERWKQLQEQAPFAPRAYHSATLVCGKYLWIIGGSDAKEIHSDVHVLNTDTLEWSTPALKVNGCRRGTHAAVLHPLKPHCILVFGGYGGDLPGGYKWLDDLSLLDTDTLEWKLVQPEGLLCARPCGRGYHSFTVFGHSILLFGGKNDGGIIEEDFLSMYNCEENKWCMLQATGDRPNPRSNHAAVLIEDSYILIHGGRYGQQRLNDIYSLDVSSDISVYKWKKYESTVVEGKSKKLKMADATLPEGRAAHCLIVREHSLYMFGGYGGGRRTFSDMYVVRRFPCQVKQKTRSSKVYFVSLPVEEAEDNEGWLSTKRQRKAPSAIEGAGTSDPYDWTSAHTPEKKVQHCAEFSVKKCNLKRKSPLGSQERDNLRKELEVLQHKYMCLEQELKAQITSNKKIATELESVEAERDHLQNTEKILQGQLEAEKNKVLMLQAEIDGCVAATQKTDILSTQLKEELQRTVSALETKEREKQELISQLNANAKKLEERERSLDRTKGLYEDAVLERDEYKSCVQRLEVELQKQIQTLQQAKSNYDAERSFLLQEVAERKGTADRIFTELGISKESCRAMQEHAQLLTKQLEQANEKLDRQQKEKEELHRSNGLLTAELKQVTTARDGAESNLKLLKTELESARTLIDRNALEAIKMKENADEAACHIATLHSSLKKAQEEVQLRIAENNNLRSHLYELEEFEQGQLKLLQKHIEKLQCARQSCPTSNMRRD